MNSSNEYVCMPPSSGPVGLHLFLYIGHCKRKYIHITARAIMCGFFTITPCCIGLKIKIIQGILIYLTPGVIDIPLLLLFAMHDLGKDTICDLLF